jgi:hypothetical protein
LRTPAKKAKIATMIQHAHHTATFPTQADYVRALELARIQALLQRDMPLLWQLHAPDYELVSAGGRVFTRERYLHVIESGALQYLRWEPQDIQVRSSPTTALVRYPLTLQLGSHDGAGEPFACWHIDAYELRGDVWQAVWSQATKAPAPD